MAVLAILYPKPARYEWKGTEWKRNKDVSVNTPADRRFLLDYDDYGTTRSNSDRVRVEVVAILLIGIGLAFAAKDPSEPSISRLVGILTVVASLTLIVIAALAVKAGDLERELLVANRHLRSMDIDLSYVESTVSSIERDVSSIESDVSTVKIDARYR